MAQFYEALKARGLPDEVVAKFTEEYFKKRMEAMPSLGELFKQFTGKGFTKHTVITQTKKEQEKEEE